MESMEPTVIRNDERGRYELRLADAIVGYADFVVEGDRVVLPHTVIDPAHRGSGMAATLVRAALNDVVAQDRTVVPTCWYVAQFIERNPQYQDLVAS